MEKKVVIYTTLYCPYCTSAKKFLQSKNIPFQEVDVTDDEETRRLLVQKTGRETVPQIFVNDQSLGGYDDLVAHFQKNKSL